MTHTPSLAGTGPTQPEPADHVSRRNNSASVFAPPTASVESQAIPSLLTRSWLCTLSSPDASIWRTASRVKLAGSERLIGTAFVLGYLPEVCHGPGLMPK